MTKPRRVVFAVSTFSLVGAALVACEDESTSGSPTFSLPESSGLTLDASSSSATPADGSATATDGSSRADGGAIRDASASDAANDAFLSLPGDRGGAMLPSAPSSAGASEVLLFLFAMPA